MTAVRLRMRKKISASVPLPLFAASLLLLALAPAVRAEDFTPTAANATAAAPGPALPPTAPIARDLGEGLSFYRAHALPADLPKTPAKPSPLVLDLRFATAAPDAATAFEAWLKFRAAPASPVLVLINAATAAPLRAVLAAEKSYPGLVTLGPSSSEIAPDIAVDATADEDKSAYDALEHGAVLDSLLKENADKLRNDEAALIRERANPPEDPTSPAADSDDTPSDLAEKSPAPPSPPPIIDATLQRAVHLHRALLALKRL